MNPALGSELSRLLFQGVVWGTVGKVAVEQWRAAHSARETTALTRRAATRRACHSYQQLHLSMLRAHQAQLDQHGQWQHHLEQMQLDWRNRAERRTAHATSRPAVRTAHAERRSHLRAA